MSCDRDRPADQHERACAAPRAMHEPSLSQARMHSIAIPRPVRVRERNLRTQNRARVCEMRCRYMSEAGERKQWRRCEQRARSRRDGPSDRKRGVKNAKGKRRRIKRQRVYKQVVACIAAVDACATEMQRKKSCAIAVMRWVEQCAGACLAGRLRARRTCRASRSRLAPPCATCRAWTVDTAG